MRSNTSLFVVPLYLGWAYVGTQLLSAIVEYKVFPISQLLVISHWLSLGNIGTVHKTQWKKQENFIVFVIFS
jgi:hypothetical protein